jgi:pimeloyl-ACP methyl ester carboxylesterase
LPHNRVTLALHRLRGPSAPLPADGNRNDPLLLLHGLGEETPSDVPEDVSAWPGAIWGLDFTGHGRSTVPRGGGYTCEVLMADADVAVDHLGGAALYGRGLGGYVAVLLARTRPGLVRAANVAVGPGLAGAGPRAGEAAPALVVPEGTGGAAPDPYALHELARDVRPEAYAAGFARAAVEGRRPAPAVVVCARERTPWLAAVVREPGVETVAVDVALSRLFLAAAAR